MLETAVAQLRLVASITLGKPFALWSLEWLIEAMLDTQREFGEFNAEAKEFLAGPPLDEETRRELHLSRFQKQAVRAARETTYYAHLFEQIGLDPSGLRYEDIDRIPLTTRLTVAASPEAFVRRAAQPRLQTMSAGRNGPPLDLYFSDYELRLTTALTALEVLLQEQVSRAEVVQINTPPEALSLTYDLGSAYTRLGALVHQVGPVEPVQALALLAAERPLPGRPSQPTTLVAYPSYLGELIECGQQLGYHPDRFGLERIIIGGELLTEGLKARCRRLFGSVQFKEDYRVTALLPLHGACDDQTGRLQFDALPGLIEIINPDTAAPARPGEIGTIVATPFLPYRDTTLLLRYDTQDVVRCAAEPTATLQTSPILGKLTQAARHEQGWTFPREVQEALEALDEVPLPARYGFWAAPGGVAVEVLVREVTAAVRDKIETGLAERGVPLGELHLVVDRGDLQRPLPLRCDVRRSSSRPSPGLAPASPNGNRSRSVTSARPDQVEQP